MSSAQSSAETISAPLLHKLFPHHQGPWLEEVWEYVDRLARRFPSAPLSHLPWLLASCSPTAARHRTAKWIVGLACRLGRLAKEVGRRAKIDPSTPHISICPFAVVADYLFEQQRVLGIIIAAKLPNADQFLPDGAPFNAAQSISPALQLASEVSLTYFDPTTSTHFFYFEIERCGHALLTLQERLSLIKELPLAIGERIEKRTPSVFKPSNEENARRPSGKTLRLCFDKVRPSLDPRLRTDRQSQPLLSLLYEGLMKLDSAGQPIEGMAKEVEISSDRRLYRFHLRKSYWSNGEPITAYDFEHGWKTFLSPKSPNYVSFVFFPIKGVLKPNGERGCVDDIGLKAPDAQTLVVELERPTPHFLAYLTNPVFSPLYQNIDHLHPGWAFGRPDGFIGNGPFIPLKMDGETLHLAQNPHYWDRTNVSHDRIEILQSDTSEDTSALWEKGRLDWIGDPLCPIPAAEIERVKDNIPLREFPTGAVCCLYFNTQHAPFNDPKNREGIAHVIQGNSRLATTFPLGARETKRYVPPKIGLWTPPPFHADIPLRLPPTLELIYPKADDFEGICRGIAQELEGHFGIRVSVKGVEWAQFNASGAVSSTAHLKVANWFPWCGDPMCYFDRFLTLNPINFSRWKNKSYNRMVEDANLASTEKERFSHLRQAEALLLKEAPLVPLYFYTYHYASRKDAQLLDTHEIGLINLNVHMHKGSCSP